MIKAMNRADLAHRLKNDPIFHERPGFASLVLMGMSTYAPGDGTELALEGSPAAMPPLTRTVETDPPPAPPVAPTSPSAPYVAPVTRAAPAPTAREEPEESFLARVNRMAKTDATERAAASSTGDDLLDAINKRAPTMPLDEPADDLLDAINQRVVA